MSPAVFEPRLAAFSSPDQQQRQNVHLSVGVRHPRKPAPTSARLGQRIAATATAAAAAEHRALFLLTSDLVFCKRLSQSLRMDIR